LDEELQFHIDHQIEENLAAGMEPEEARRAAFLIASDPSFPESCMRNPEFRERSLFDPTENPRTIEPLFCRFAPNMSSIVNPPRGRATLRESFPVLSRSGMSDRRA